MSEENQTFIPDSFLALHRDARGRLTTSKAEIASAYELCEDMANLLIDHCQTVHHRDGVDEDQILTRCHRGLLVPGGQFTPPQAWWVACRTAELLGWHWDTRPEPPGTDG